MVKKVILSVMVIALVAAVTVPTGALYLRSSNLGTGSVSGYVIATPTPTPSPISVVFTVTDVSSPTYFDYTITITNNTNKSIKDWSLSFKYDGYLYNAWVCWFWSSGSTYYFEPINKWQDNYTIEPNSSITLYGNGATQGTRMWNVMLNNQPVDYTYNPKS